MDNQRRAQIEQSIIWQAMQAWHRNHHNREEIETRQLLYLKRLLRHVQQHSPWYAEKLSSLDIDDITLQKFSESVPVITKRQFVENWDRIITVQTISKSGLEEFLINESKHADADYVFSDSYHVISTSGSSGISGLYLYTDEEWASFCSQYYRYPSRFSDKKLRIVNLTVRSRLFALPKSIYSSLNPLISYLELDTCDGNQIVIRELNKFQPEILVTLPSILHKLCQWQQDKILDIKPMQITTGAEPLTKHLRLRVTAIWPGTELKNNYGGSEGFSGLGCKYNDDLMHFNEDYCLVENGRNGGVFITNLFAKTVPLIRFHVDDAIRFAPEGQCPHCGIYYRGFYPPLGRLYDDFIYDKHICITRLQLVGVMNQFPQILEYQFCQIKNGIGVTITEANGQMILAMAACLRDTLQRSGLKNPNVQIDVLPSIKRQRSGKLNQILQPGALTNGTLFDN